MPIEIHQPGSAPPKISVVIPTLNEGKRIRNCLLSIANQDFPYSYEVIVIDGGSNDNTLKIVKSFDVTRVEEAELGRGRARQLGAEVATGDILIFTEADCIVPSDWLLKYYQIFTENPSVIGFSGSYEFIRGKKSINLVLKWIFSFTDMVVRFTKGESTFRGTNFGVRREDILRHGGFKQQFSPFDDVEAGYRLANFGHVRYVPELKVKTDNRRIKGRLMSYLKEYALTYTKVFLLNSGSEENRFLQIR